MVRDVVLLPGDGIGPEIAEATKRVVAAAGAEIRWREWEVGEAALERTGTPLPDSVLDAIRECGVALKGPVTTPVGRGFRSINVALRRELDLYACVRPCRTYPGVRTPFPDLDLVIVRENTEDLYAGIEFERGSREAAELIEWILKRRPDARLDPESGISIKPISETATRRIVRFAFDYARRHGRRKVTAVHKANIMKHSDGLFLEVAHDVAKENLDIEFSHRIVDNMCMQLVQYPYQYDVLVLPNLYGDIISDLAAGMIGGLGLAPGANVGDRCAVFEATHGSAPDIAGMNRANPCGLILSAVLLLRHIGQRTAARRLEAAVAAVLAEGESLTADLYEDPHDPRAVGTREMAEAIARHAARLAAEGE